MNKNASLINRLVSAFVNMEYAMVIELVKNALDSEILPQDVLKGMQ